VCQTHKDTPLREVSAGSKEFSAAASKKTTSPGRKPETSKTEEKRGGNPGSAFPNSCCFANSVGLTGNDFHPQPVAFSAPAKTTPKQSMPSPDLARPPNW